MRRVLKQRIRSTVIVTLKNGSTFTGILYDHDDQTLVLVAAKAILNGNATPVDGELVVYTDDVHFMQIP